MKQVILFVGLLLVGVVGVAALHPAFAQSNPPSAFGAPAARAALQQAPFGSGILGWIAAKQQSMQRELASTVKRLKKENAFAAALALAGLSFVYGVLHAVGPGHGKAIISSYVVANEETARRGIVISFIAAAMQALTAVALVSVLLLAFNATGLQLTAWSNQLESVSYAMVALVGLYMLVTQLLRLWRRQQGHAVADHAYSGGGHDHAHGHHHTEGEACDHMVDARAIAGPVSRKKMAAVVFAVGIRPCTGAILVLVFALAQGLFWAGVAATFAMALGTAMTVAVLATIAIGSRELALKLGGENSTWANAVRTICGIGGSLLIFGLGATLFAASLGPARPF